MAAAPQESLPNQCKSWCDLKAAYRLLSNPRVDPQAIQGPHRVVTLEACAKHPLVLCVQDDTSLDFSLRSKVKGLGRIGDGGGRGIMQHSTLAVLESGELLGVLDQRWFNRCEPAPGETRRQQRARWCESDVWADAVKKVGELRNQHAPSIPTRFVHVADRAGDVWTTMRACDDQAMGFLVRAQHDRKLDDGDSRLWQTMQEQAVVDTMTVQVRAQRDGRGRITRKKRTGTVSIRYGQVSLRPPVNDPRWTCDGPRQVWAIYVHEDQPPNGEGVEPIDWMLLTSEPVQSAVEVRRIIGWYRCRWLVEEWHRVLKEGCKLESSQLDDAVDIQRLAAIQSIVSVRMIQLRDLAGFGDDREDQPSRQDESENPQVLQDTVPWTWIRVVAALTKIEPTHLTSRQFWLGIAKQGGFIGRKRDGRPGWKAIWRGWYEISIMVRGAELFDTGGQKCG